MPDAQLTSRPGRGIDDETLQRIHALVEEALFKTAHEHLTSLPAPESWDAPEAIWLASRVLFHVGAPARSSRVVLCALRRSPNHPALRTALLYERFNHRGPWFAWRAFRVEEPPDEASSKTAVRYWLLGAQLASLMHDTPTAEKLLRRAEATGEAQVHCRLGRCLFLEHGDRLEEALQVARGVLVDAPKNVHVVHATTNLLRKLHRLEQAREVVMEAEEGTESGQFALLRASLELELQHFDQAQAALERAKSFMPIAEPEIVGNVHGMLSDCAYYLGDYERCIDLARKCGENYFIRLADRIEGSKPNPKRVHLDVPFVQQHHATCAPATLTAIAKYWKRSVDHVEVADAICYDGTRPHRDRAWAKENGWEARELTLRWETALALLDAGLPFTLVTVDGLRAHMQAVTGYDERRGVLLLRDPSVSARVEADASMLLDSQAPYGPRAMLLVPPEEASRAEGIELPDESLYEVLHKLHVELEKHDRTSAQRQLDELRELAPEHRITLFAQRAIALYDGDPEAILSACDQLIAQHSEDWGSHALALQAMETTRSRAERMQRIETLLARDDVHPAMLEIAAAELSVDARDRDRASRLARRLLRMGPLHAGALYEIGRMSWSSQRFDEAFDAFRFAAGLEPTNDHKAQAMFVAALGLGRTQQAVDFLQERARSYRARSAQPTTTLFEALESVDRVDEAIEALEEGLAARPEDGALLLFAARAHTRLGKRKHAQALLASARGLASPVDELRASAELDEAAGNPHNALEKWRRVVELDPFASDGHAAVVRLLTTLEGVEAARSHMQEATRQHPYRRDLATLWLESLDGSNPQRVCEALAYHLEHVPGNAWAWRVLSELRARQNQLDDARQALDRAAAIEPSVAGQHVAEAFVAIRARQWTSAKHNLREALRISADLPGSIARLVDLADDEQERRSLLDFVAEQVRTRSVDGRGVQTWYAIERESSTPAECAARVDEMRTTRPDLWASWSIAVRHAFARGKRKTALQLVREARERFPSVPQLLLDEADLNRLRGKPQRSIRSYERAYVLAPDPAVALRLCQTLTDLGETEQARTRLAGYLRRHPLCSDLIVLDSIFQWRQAEHAQALSLLEAVLMRDPHHDEAWRVLHQGRKAMGEKDGALTLAASLLDSRPWDGRMWLRSAWLHLDLGHPEQALEATRRASEIDPFDIDALDQRAQALALLGNKEEALEVCAQSEGFAGAMALPLRGRDAWIRFLFGDRDQAIRRMRELVSKWPSYQWGFRNLCEWLRNQKDHEGALEVAQRLCELAPLDAESRVALGEAHAHAGDRQQAAKAFRRALQLDPQNVPALAHSVRDAIEDRDWDAVATLLEKLDAVDAPLAALWRTRMAAERKDPRAYREALEALLDDDVQHVDLVQSAVVFAANKMLYGLTDIVHGLALRPGALAILGELWAAVLCHQGHPPDSFALRNMIKQSPDAGLAACFVVIEHYGQEGRGLAGLWTVAWLWPIPWKDDNLWGAVSFLLQGFFVQPLLPLWFRGYRKREGLQPWMLLNYAISLRRWYAYDRARDLHRYALTLPADHAVNHHQVWLAFYEACNGDAERARSLLQLRPEPIGPFEQSLVKIVEGVLIARGQEDVPDDERYVQAQIRMGHALTTEAHPGSVRRVLRHAERVVARERRMYFAWLWSVTAIVCSEAVRWIWSWVALLAAIYAVRFVLTT